MKMKQNLRINQSQRLTFSLKMQQSLKILQLSYAEMIEKINKELDNNPLLEPELEKNDRVYQKKNYLENFKTNSKSEYIENTLEQKKNLRDHINEQINIDITNNEEKLIAKKFLEYIDNNGYIKYEDVKQIMILADNAKVLSDNRELYGDNINIQFNDSLISSIGVAGNAKAHNIIYA